MKTAGPVIVSVVLVAAIAFAVGSGFMDAGTVILVFILGVIAVPIASKLGTEVDHWMWWVGPAAYLAKLIGSGVRYAVLFGAYEGSGDAVRYHNNGLDLADSWRSLSIPPIGGGTGAGTQFVDSITGLIYAIHKPTLLGGFFIFATLAFFGQLLFYAAFRRAIPGGNLPMYALLVFFLPGLVFWPSSIGKESLMVLFLGVATYGLTRAFQAYGPGWLILAAFGLAGAGAVRPHIAALLAGSFVVAAALGRGQWLGAIALRRVTVVALSIMLLGATALLVGDRFNIAGPEDVDPFVNEIERRTSQGGSAITGGAIASAAQLPSAALRVLFRPLPHEAHNLQSFASALENTALLGLIILRLPSMIRRIGLLRVPFVLMGTTFTVGFVVAFSTIFNLGILTRQRAQVLPFLLAVLVALGWDMKRPSGPAKTAAKSPTDIRGFSAPSSQA